MDGSRIAGGYFASGVPTAIACHRHGCVKKEGLWFPSGGSEAAMWEFW